MFLLLYKFGTIALSRDWSNFTLLDKYQEHFKLATASQLERRI